MNLYCRVHVGKLLSMQQGIIIMDMSECVPTFVFYIVFFNVSTVEFLSLKVKKENELVLFKK